ncbi:hypothetical protein [Streptomyces sp. NPDC002779]|uniref:hypothetical protein n=1 Tax=Streptomyces sp. NPDC002779 TaxID=3364664 RepID=UPI00367A2B3C
MKIVSFICHFPSLEDWRAEVDGCVVAAETIDLGDLVLGAAEADPQPFDFAEPAFAFGFGDAGDKVVADVDEPCPLGWIWSEE